VRLFLAIWQTIEKLEGLGSFFVLFGEDRADDDVVVELVAVEGVVGVGKIVELV
jgi:hypothetical protein